MILNIDSKIFIQKKILFTLRLNQFFQFHLKLLWLFLVNQRNSLKQKVIIWCKFYIKKKTI